MTGRSMVAHNEGFKSGERAGRLAAAAEIERLRVPLQRYAEQYCEGWCKDNPPNAIFSDCGGCLARITLNGDGDGRH